MIEFLAGMGVVLAYQKREKWLPVVKKTAVDLKNKIFKGEEDDSTSNKKEQKEFDFDFDIKEGSV